MIKGQSYFIPAGFLEVEIIKLFEFVVLFHNITCLKGHQTLLVEQ